MQIPEISNAIELITLPFEEDKHKGVNYYAIPNQESNLVKLEVYVHAGVKYQDHKFQAKIYGELISQGTEGYPGDLLMQKIDSIGAYLSVVVNRDYLILELVFMSKFEAEALHLIEEILYRPLFSEDAFNRVLQQFKNQFSFGLSKSSTIASKSYLKELYKGHYYGVFAGVDDFDYIDLAKVEAFKQVVQNQIQKVFVSGDFSKSFIASLQQQLSFVKSKEKPLANALKNKFCAITYHTEKFNQDTIRLGQIIPQNSDEILKLKLANVVFGGYFGSRLMQEIREEKGWSYGIHSTIVYQEESKYLMVASDVKKGKGNAAIKSIVDQMTDLQNKRVLEEELAQAKNYLLGSMLQGLDGVFEQMEALKFSVSTNINHQKYFEQMHEELNAIDPNTLMEVYQKYMQSDKWLRVLVD